MQDYSSVSLAIILDAQQMVVAQSLKGY